MAITKQAPLDIPEAMRNEPMATEETMLHEKHDNLCLARSDSAVVQKYSMSSFT